MNNYLLKIVSLKICFTFFMVKLNAQNNGVKIIDNKGTIKNINKVSASNSTPTSNIEGDIWFDTSIATNTTIKIWDNNIGGVAGWREFIDGVHKGTTGSIFFAGTDGAPTENNKQLFWDNNSNKLLIGSVNSGIPVANRGKVNVFGSVTTTRGFIGKKRTNEITYRFLNDTNTGIHSPDNDVLRFSTNGTQAVTILANQNVGIGTTSPNSTLQIKGSVSKSIIEITSGTGDFNLTEDHHTIIVKTNRNIILPNANTCEGRIYVIKNVSGNMINTSSYTNELNTNISSLSNNKTIWVQSNGTVWTLISSTAIPRTKAAGKVTFKYSGYYRNYNSHNLVKSFNVASVTRINEGDYQVTFIENMSDNNYVIQLSILDCGGDCPGNNRINYDDPGITYYNQTPSGFRINIGDSDNGSGQKDDIDLEFMFTVIDW